MTRKLILASFALACMTLGGCGGGSGPGESAAGFFKAAGAGDAEKAKSFVAPEDKAGDKGKMFDLMLPKFAEAAKAKGGIKSVTVVEEKIDGDTATVKLKFEFGNGTTENEEGKMKRVGGKWYLAADKEDK
jgi:hypothetical protein